MARVYATIVDKNKLPNKNVTFQTLADAAKFLGIYAIIGQDDVSWTINYYSGSKNLVFKTNTLNSTLQFQITKNIEFDAGIKGTFSINDIDSERELKQKEFIMTDTKGTITLKLEFEIQVYINEKYSYLQNNDYSYSELFKQGKNNVTSSLRESNIYILNENKNGYPKVEIPRYGIGGKCIQGYSDIFALENYGIYYKENSNNENVDVYYGNTLDDKLKDTTLQDTTKIYKPEQFRSKSFGLVKETLKLKNFYNWENYAAEQRIMISLTYNKETKILNIKNYGIHNYETFWDIKQLKVQKETSTGPTNQTIVKYTNNTDTLDITWNNKLDLISEENVTLNSNVIILEVFHGESFDIESSNLSTENTSLFADKISGPILVYNDNFLQFFDTSFNKENLTWPSNYHRYTMFLSSNSNLLKIKPKYYRLALKDKQEYILSMTNIYPKTLKNPSIFFGCWKTPGDLSKSDPVVFTTNNLIYSCYDGIFDCNLKSELVELNWTQDSENDPIEYYIYNDLLFDYTSTQWNYEQTDNDSYNINIFLNGSSKQYIENNGWQEWHQTNTDWSARIYTPIFNWYNKNSINAANIKGLEGLSGAITITEKNNKVPYYFLNDINKNYFISYTLRKIVTESNHLITETWYKICPPFYFNAASNSYENSWTKLIISYPNYGLCYNYNSNNEYSLNGTCWLEELINRYYTTYKTSEDFIKNTTTFFASINDFEFWHSIWDGDHQQSALYYFTYPFPQNAQSLIGGKIYNLMGMTSYSKGLTYIPICIYPEYNRSISGCSIYGRLKEDN